MKDRLKRLYEGKKLTAAGLAAAVVKGWITAEEYEAITGEAYSE